MKENNQEVKTSKDAVTKIDLSKILANRDI